MILHKVTPLVFRDPVELAPERYGIDTGSEQLIDLTGVYHGGAENQHMSADQLIQCLEKTYCDTVAAEFQHLRVNFCGLRTRYSIPCNIISRRSHEGNQNDLIIFISHAHIQN